MRKIVELNVRERSPIVLTLGFLLTSLLRLPCFLGTLRKNGAFRLQQDKFGRGTNMSKQSFRECPPRKEPTCFHFMLFDHD
jgi:hypothetical protein